MKKTFFAQLLFFLLCIISCTNETRIIKTEPTAERVLEDYYKAISDLDNLTYRMHKVDSFLSGAVWDKTGYCILKRDPSEPLFGFLFKGKRDDKDEEVIFYGDEMLEINLKTKEYQIEREQIHRGVLGSTGGQMVLDEIMLNEKGYNKLSLTTTDSSFILRFDYPEKEEPEIKNRYKELHLDKKTYLPFYRYHTLISYGEKQANIAALSEMTVNSDNFEDPFTSKDFLKDFKIVIPKRVEKKGLALLNQTAPDFELSDINGNISRLSDQKGKLILLDFWEVWCGPCVKSIPHLKEFSNKYGSQEFEILSIVSDPKTFNQVQKIASRKELNYKVLYGTNDIAKQYFVNAVPLYVLVDKMGTIRHVSYGFSSEIETQIKKYL